MTTQDIVQKLWNLCDVLRDDGINYSDYVTELVLLLFIKMEHESTESGVLHKHKLPDYARWGEFTRRSGMDLLLYYKEALLKLSQSTDPLIAAIYADAQTSLKEPRHLEQLVKSLDGIDWFSAERDGLGDLYEGLLEKNASETKSGAGQYFTPRPLIDTIIQVIKPQAGETVQDPAAGTGGFLIAADRAIKERTDNLYDLTERERQFQRNHAFVGMELVTSTRRLALMNCLLHGMEGDDQGVVHLGNTLASAGSSLPRSDVMLSNPPFGTARGGGGPTRDDLTFATSNKQLAFLQHIVRHLKDGGRAAVVLPDGFLFGEGVKARIKEQLLQHCNLHTIVRLPNGVFAPYTGIKSNLLFFTKGQPTQHIWYYEHPYPPGVKNYNKTKPIRIDEFDLEKAWWGTEADGFAARVENERAWKVGIDQIKAAGYNLDQKNPHVGEQQSHDPEVLLSQFRQLTADAQDIRDQIKGILSEALVR